jgi:hypothetical protein
LASYNIPKEDVADGIVISKDPLVKVYGKALGPEFWKVLIKNAINPKASLERPLKKMRTVGQAVGRMVAWRICDVCYNKKFLFCVIANTYTFKLICISNLFYHLFFSGV